jgi:hypothetical protein
MRQLLPAVTVTVAAAIPGVEAYAASAMCAFTAQRRDRRCRRR